jgi:CRP-like cAMP-binding protein
LRQAATPDTALFTLLRDYAHASFIEIAQLAACYRVHTPVQRCARWLCMVQDRLGRGDFFITQETLASRLGIRRSTITRAMGVLQDRGAVRYRRGEFAVADRQALEALSCECYAIIKRYHHRIMAL